MNAWLKGLLAAAIGGGATGVTQTMSTTGHVNSGTVVSAGVGALVTVLAYLIKSPLAPSGNTGLGSIK